MLSNDRSMTSGYMGFKMDQTKRTGIFEYDRLMDSFIKDLAVKFAEVGYAVDLFIKMQTLVQISQMLANLTILKISGSWILQPIQPEDKY